MEWRRFALTGSTLALLASVWSCQLFAPRGPFHPDPNPVGGYTIEVKAAGGDFETVVIGAESEECERFVANNDLDRTCRIAINLIPSLIGGEAHGELNDRHTPAFDALVWRARADGDPSVCARGGLEGEFIVRCEDEASDSDYAYVAPGWSIRVPIGGAIPLSTE